MSIEWVRRYCLSLPHTTEKVQWGNDLVFKIAEKMYAVAALEPGEVWLSLKCAPEEFAELTQRPGIIPAPYLARAQWIALESDEALSVEEVRRLLRQSYEIVRARLSKRAQSELEKVRPKNVKRQKSKAKSQ